MAPIKKKRRKRSRIINENAINARALLFSRKGNGQKRRPQKK